MLILLLALAMLSDSSQACSTFQINDQQQHLTAKRFDFYSDLGIITTHVQGQKRTALVHEKFVGQPVSWVSKFGSVTFALAGTEFPIEGMNEKGLVAQSLHNYGTVFPESKDGLPYINNRQLVQFILDTASDLEEALTVVRSVHIDPLFPQDQHFFVCDASGGCAVIEFIAGQLVINSRDQLLKPLITNFPYSDSVAGKPDLKGDTRYTRAFALLSKVPNQRSKQKAYAFSILDQLKTRHTAWWEAVYDQSKRIVYFRSAESPNEKSIQLSEISFSPSAKPRMIDIHFLAAGDVTRKMSRYDKKIDEGYVKNILYGFGQEMEKKYPGIIRAMVAYPDKADQSQSSPYGSDRGSWR